MCCITPLCPTHSNHQLHTYFDIKDSTSTIPAATAEAAVPTGLLLISMAAPSSLHHCRHQSITVKDAQGEPIALHSHLADQRPHPENQHKPALPPTATAMLPSSRPVTNKQPARNTTHLHHPQPLHPPRMCSDNTADQHYIITPCGAAPRFMITRHAPQAVRVTTLRSRFSVTCCSCAMMSSARITMLSDSPSATSSSIKRRVSMVAPMCSR